MKVKMKLVEAKYVDGESGEKYYFTFKPTLDDWKDKIKFVVSCTDPFETMGKLDLPQSKGDNIILEMSTKETQAKLPKTEKKEKD